MALVIGLLIPMLGIVFGSAVVFLTRKEMSGMLQQSLLGFAAGVMVAASFWSLLLPAVEIQGDTLTEKGEMKNDK